MEVKYFDSNTVIGAVAIAVQYYEKQGFPIAKVDLTPAEYAAAKYELGASDEELLSLPLTAGRSVYFEVDGKNPRVEQLKAMVEAQRATKQ